MIQMPQLLLPGRVLMCDTSDHPEMMVMPLLTLLATMVMILVVIMTPMGM